MKNQSKLLLIVIIYLFSTVTIYGQTTEEEYNYVTKGYKIQIESGLDMKRGYEFKDVDTWGLNYGSFERNATFKQLYREGESIPCATLMIFKRTDTEYEEYICIPSYSSTNNIWEKAFNDFKVSTKDWTTSSQGYVWGMLKMISYLSAEK